MFLLLLVDRFVIAYFYAHIQVGALQEIKVLTGFSPRVRTAKAPSPPPKLSLAVTFGEGRGRGTSSRAAPS